MHNGQQLALHLKAPTTQTIRFFSAGNKIKCPGTAKRKTTCSKSITIELWRNARRLSTEIIKLLSCPFWDIDVIVICLNGAIVVFLFLTQSRLYKDRQADMVSTDPTWHGVIWLEFLQHVVFRSIVICKQIQLKNTVIQFYSRCNFNELFKFLAQLFNKQINKTGCTAAYRNI